MIKTIVEHVANGGSALDLCNTWKVSFSTIMKAIKSNPDYDKEYQAAIISRDEWAKERILKEQQALAMFNIKDAYNADGTIKPIQQMPDHVTAAIKEIDSDGGVKFLDKNKSLDQYHKQMGLFVDKKEVSGTISWEHILNEAAKLDIKD
jgi:hypothetical protein